MIDFNTEYLVKVFSQIRFSSNRPIISYLSIINIVFDIKGEKICPLANGNYLVGCCSQTCIAYCISCLHCANGAERCGCAVNNRRLYIIQQSAD